MRIRGGVCEFEFEFEFERERKGVKSIENRRDMRDFTLHSKKRKSVIIFVCITTEENEFIIEYGYCRSCDSLSYWYLAIPPHQLF
jgi:predicted nucleic acid-binding Zn finger protein